MKQCINCGSKNIITTEVDERSLYYCPECDFIEYGKREYSSGYLSIVDEITQRVFQYGTYKIEWVILINSAFKKEYGGSSSEFQLIDWAGKNYLTYNFIENGKYIVFSRSKPIKIIKNSKDEVFGEYISVRGVDQLVKLCAIERKNYFSYVAYIGKKRIPYPVYNASKIYSDTFHWGYEIYKEWLLSNPNALNKILKKAGY